MTNHQPAINQADGLVDDFEGKAASVLEAVRSSGSAVRIRGESARLRMAV